MPYGDDTITVNCYLLPLPGTGPDLQTMLYLVPQATNSLNGSTYRTYTSVDDVNSDEGAGYISATTANDLTAAFSQVYGRPKTILVGRCDLVGGDHYDDALDDCIAAGADFFGVAVQTTTVSEMILVAQDVEARAATDPRVYLLQSASTDWYGATWPAAFSAIEGFEWTAICYHDKPVQPYGLCLGAARLAYDPDEQSAAWRCELKALAQYTTALTSAQLTNAAANNVNLVGRGMGATFWSDLGLNANGRAIDHLVSTAWLKYTIIAQIQATVAAYAARGEKLPVSQAGARVIETLVAGVANQGVGIGHFDRYTDSSGVQYPRTSSTYSRTNNSITVTLDLYFANQVQTITVNAYLNEAEA